MASLDALARILDRGRQVFEREGVGVHFVASKRFCVMNASARCVALLPSPRMP